jgi:hypothetical protein
MNSRFKANNLVAILIAIILIAAGFALAFMHRQTESNKNLGQVKIPTKEIAVDLSSGNQSSLHATQIIDT